MMRSVFLFSTFLLSLSSFAAGMIYQPTPWDPKTAQVMVVIHGCLQSAESMAIGTGWNKLADKNNVLVIYPQVPAKSNAIDCWSWFLPENQTNKSGQLKVLHDEIQAIKKQYGVDKAKTFVAGLSSGAATVNGLLACFPDAFAGGASHSGPAYGMVTTEAQAGHALKLGPTSPKTPPPCDTKKFKGKLMVIQGDKDIVVNPKHADRIIVDFVPPTAQKNVLPVKTENSLGVEITDYSVDNKVMARLVKIQGLDHAWSGFSFGLRNPPMQNNELLKTKLPFFSEKGPSATEMIWDFFKN